MVMLYCGFRLKNEKQLGTEQKAILFIHILHDKLITVSKTYNFARGSLNDETPVCMNSSPLELTSNLCSEV